MTKTLSAVLLFLCFLTLRSQSTAIPKFTTSTPEVYAFEKNISVPVSYHTGLPSIQVPIYTINSGNINMPIALSYHAQGIRVEEVATRYGLGWNLQGGGAITREVRDRPDEIYYFSNPHKFVGMTENPQKLAAFHLAFMDDITDDLDNNPDIFSFSVAGLSGKFFFDQATRKIILQSFEDLKVTELDNGSNSTILEGFLITDTKGTKYYFGRSADGLTNEREESESIATSFYQFFGEDSGTPDYTPPGYYTGNTSGGDYIARWSLVEIIDIFGNRAMFRYGSERLHYTKRIFDGHLHPRMKVLMPGPGARRRVSMKGIATNTTRFLKEITFPEGRIEFLPASSPRQDIENNPSTSPLSAYAIERINVTDKFGAQVSSHKLEFEYVEGTDTSNTLSFYLPTNQKRLFLKSIRQSAFENSVEKLLPPYDFTYSNIKLPNRFSNSIDWWGFYNGRQNGNTYDPFSMQSTMDFLVSYNINGGREVGPEFSQAGMLKKITYPTGGSSEYEYEQNSVTMPRFMAETLNFFRNPRIAESLNFVDNSTTDNTIGQVYRSPDFDIRAPALSTTRNAQVYVHGHNFSSPGLNGGSFHPNPQFGTELPTQMDTDRPFSLSLVCNYTYDSSPGTSFALNFGGFNFLANIKSGNYHLRAQRIKNRTGPFPEFAVGMSWMVEAISPSTEMFVGGNRIKRVTLDDGYGNQMTKRYEYKRLGTSISSGLLSAFPFYFEQIGGPSGYFTLGPPIHTFTNGPTSHAGYSAVTEYIESSLGNQKIEYEFTSSPNEGRFHKTPFANQVDNEWLRGKPKKNIYYKLKDGVYSKTKETITKYNYPPFLRLGYTDPAYPPDVFDMEQGYLPKAPINSQKQYFLSLPKPTSLIDFNFQIAYQGNYYKFEVTYIAGGIFNTKSVEEIDYLDNGQVSKKTEFFYKSPHHTQLTIKKETTSEGSDVLETKYTYAPDAGLADLVSQNRVSEPVKTESLRNTELLGTTNATYWDWNPGTAKMVLPETIQSSKGAGALEDRVRYTRVDPANGNPLEVQQEGGMKICYIWAYGKKIPVAKIENIAYASIPASLITDIQIASDALQYSETTMLQKLEALRMHASLAGAMVSTFTHRPLVGMTTATDPKGDRTTYEYDAFNRLKAVRDKDGNLLSENEYHYKNQ